MGTAIIALVAALIGAVIGAYLKKRWTSDYSVELSALRQQIEAQQKQHETLEQERLEAEHLRLDIYCIRSQRHVVHKNRVPDGTI